MPLVNSGIYIYFWNLFPSYTALSLVIKNTYKQLQTVPIMYDITGLSRYHCTMKQYTFNKFQSLYKRLQSAQNT